MPLLTKPTGAADVSAAIMEIKMSDAQSGRGMAEGRKQSLEWTQLI